MRKRFFGGSLGRRALLFWVCAGALFAPRPLLAAGPPPSGPHPRLFLTPELLEDLRANAANTESAMAGVIAHCQDVVDSPSDYAGRGYQGDGWAFGASACGLAWQVTQNPAFAEAGVRLWRTLLSDDQTMGDGLACSSTSVSAEQATASIRHDTGYAIRFIGPHTALAYDWLYDAPGVDSALLEQSRFCFRQWIDFYTTEGYHHDEPGSNYHAGYAVAKTFVAIAEAGEDGADSDRIWTETIDQLFGEQLVGEGLASMSAPLGEPVGPLVGGDWAEGWQYGILSSLEYALATRAVEEQGVPQPELDTWTNSLLLRYFHALDPARDGIYVGGDFEGDRVYAEPPTGLLQAVLVGPSSDDVAGQALFERVAQGDGAGSDAFDAIAETRNVTAQDFLTTDPSVWYLARGTRNLYARSGWAEDAFWGVFTSAPRVVSDHQHVDATNFVFSRGADALIVDPTPYGSRSTMSSNALSVDSDVVLGEYKPSQTPWSEAELVWARGTSSGVVAARGDFARAFDFADTPSDVPFAQRNWVFLPEGEIVTIDRVRTGTAAKNTYLRFNTTGTISIDRSGAQPFASTNVGASTLAIHAVRLSGGTPSVETPEVADDCFSAPTTFGACTIARFPVTQYSLVLPGPEALAVHVIDGLAQGEPPADAGSLNEPPYETTPPENDEILGTGVFRSSKQSFVLASSATDGASGGALHYGVPALNPSRHVVFDAPMDAAGHSTVAVEVTGDRCRLTVTPGGELGARPLIFTLSTAADGCSIVDDGDVPPGTVPPGGGRGGTGGGGGGAVGGGGTGAGGGPTGANGTSAASEEDDGGCACEAAGSRRNRHVAWLWAFLAGGGLVAARRWRSMEGCLLALTLSLAACSGSDEDSGDKAANGGTAGSAMGGSSGALGGSAGASGTATGGSTTGGTAGSPATDVPLILSFSATPATLPDGGGQTTLSFRVENADSLSIDEGVGAVSGDSVDVNVTETTIFTLTATNENGSASSSTAVVTGQNPSREGGRYVAMISPTGGESFLAPSTLRLVASGYDPNVYTNEPVDGRGSNASKVQFFVDDELVLEVDGSVAEYNVFKGFADGIAAGEHRVWCRGVYVDPDLVLDSVPMLITVAEPPTYERVVDLDADVMVTSSQSYELAGAPDARIRLNGNGHRILGDSGSVTLRYVDVFDLGNRDDTSEPGLDVTVTGDLVIEDSTFDTSNTLHAAFEGAATASVRRNTSRSNMRMPIGQFPDEFGDTGTSYPSWSFSGSSSGEKVFAGNNVGAGWVEFENAENWLVGGDTDADSNVLIGPRVGIYVSDSSAVEVRRNYSHHVYYGGWSQGANFELQGSPGITVEHNVVYGSSWPVRGVAGEFRYNLVLDAGHQWLWAGNNASIHHNVFVGGDNDVGGIYVLYEPPNVRVFNNTIDCLDEAATAVRLSNGDLTLSSNAFVGAPEPTVTIEGGTLTADYNAFFPGTESYSDARAPAHDLGGGEPAFADRPTETFDLDEAAIWRRETSAAEVLAIYRARYTPDPGSPLIDAGDPALGAGNDIGAVGAGTAHADDRFGMP